MVENGSKWFNMVQNCQKLSQVQNCQKLSKNYSKWSKIIKNGPNAKVQHGLKMAQNFRNVFFLNRRNEHSGMLCILVNVN